MVTTQIVKRTFLSSLALVLILATGPAALADTASNSTTGADSTNNASTSTSNTTNILSENNANVTNTITLTANTGGNTANKNTGDGTITTGDINGNLTVSNSVNSSNINPPTCCGSSDSSASNDKTGYNSENNSSVDIHNNLNITQENNMNINNRIGVNLNTGGNSADKNTGDGTINTGDINFQIGLSNSGNENSIGGPTGNNPGNNPGGNNQGNQTSVNVLAAATGAALPVTGGSLPLLQVLLVLAAGLALRTSESKLRKRFLTD